MVSSGVDQADSERGAQLRPRRLWGMGKIKAKSDEIRPLFYGLALWLVVPHYKPLRPWMRLTSTTIMAMTSRMWINPPIV